jgi:hypothetical protein
MGRDLSLIEAWAILNAGLVHEGAENLVDGIPSAVYAGDIYRLVKQAVQVLAKVLNGVDRMRAASVVVFVAHMIAQSIVDADPDTSDGWTQRQVDLGMGKILSDLLELHHNMAIGAQDAGAAAPDDSGDGTP